LKHGTQVAYICARLKRDGKTDLLAQVERAERKAGEILIGMAERGERTDRGHNSKLELQSATPTLSDLGVEKTQSHRWLLTPPAAVPRA
jgi:hypothetical protein